MGSNFTAMLKAGFAKCVMTPKPGIRMGGYRKRAAGAVGTHDELCASCAVIEQGNQKVALLSLDLIALYENVIDPIKASIQEQTGVPTSHVVVSCTHTHSGPDTIFLSEGGGDVARYCDELPGKLAALVRDAIAHLRPAQMSVVKADVTGVSFNRRLKLKDGSVVLNLAPVDEKQIAERGVVDSQATAVLFEFESDVLGVIINFTLHATVLNEENLLFSKDYPGYLVEHIADRLPGNPTTLFFNGAFGDINQIGTPGVWISTYDEAKRLGDTIASALVAGCEKRQYVAGDRLRCRYQRLILPHRKTPFVDIEELDAELTRLQAKLSCTQGTDRGNIRREICFLQETKRVTQMGTFSNADIQVLNIGEVEIVAVPGELFVEYGIEMKRRSNSQHCLIFGNSNGYIGYIPLRRSFNEGAYETRFGLTSRFVPEAGDMIMETVNNMRRTP